MTGKWLTVRLGDRCQDFRSPATSTDRERAKRIVRDLSHFSGESAVRFLMEEFQEIRRDLIDAAECLS